MPLLLVEPDQGPPPPETDIEVQGGRAVTLRVHRGQMLAIEAPDGGQVASLFAWTTADPAEWLSPHHTRVFGGTFLLRMGTRLVTNRRRPIFVVGRDSLRRHDLLLPASDETVATVQTVLAAAGLTVPGIPDPVNLFMDARLGEDGQIDVRPSPARPGERWTVRALLDANVAVAATRTGISEASSDPPRRLRVIVRNEVVDLPPDLPLATSTNQQRLFEYPN
jgi:uncharacterized protein YcgI (DUF1989 family)